MDDAPSPSAREPIGARLHVIPRTLHGVQGALVRLLRGYFTRAPGWVLITTRGRTTGLAREVLLPCERWDDGLLLISTYGWRSNWIRNMRQDPRVHVTCGGWVADGRAEIVEDPARKRELVAAHPFCPAAPFAPVHLIMRTLLRPLLVAMLRHWVEPRPIVVIHRVSDATPLSEA